MFNSIFNRNRDRIVLKKYYKIYQKKKTYKDKGKI